jgi:hypothetical protein
MTPTEDAAFSLAQARRILPRVEEAHAEHGIVGAGTVYSGAFSLALMGLLITWRCRLSDPTAIISDVLSIAHDARLFLSERHPTADPWPHFPFETACLIGLAVDSPVDEFRQLLPPLPSRNCRALSLYLPRYLDVGIVMASLTGSLPEHWPFLADTKATRHGSSLLVRTWQEYMHLALARASGDSEALQRSAHLLEGFFRKRARVAYFSGGARTDGGGCLENLRVVDYRLVAAGGRPLSRLTGLDAAVAEHLPWWGQRAGAA